MCVVAIVINVFLRSHLLVCLFIFLYCAYNVCSFACIAFPLFVFAFLVFRVVAFPLSGIDFQCVAVIPLLWNYDYVSLIVFMILPSVLLLHVFASVVAKLLSSDIPLQLFVFVITYVLLVSMGFHCFLFTGSLILCFDFTCCCWFCINGSLSILMISYLFVIAVQHVP